MWESCKEMHGLLRAFACCQIIMTNDSIMKWKYGEKQGNAWALGLEKQCNSEYIIYSTILAKNLSLLHEISTTIGKVLKLWNKK